jgi:hypothetical protein
MGDVIGEIQDIGVLRTADVSASTCAHAHLALIGAPPKNEIKPSS